MRTIGVLLTLAAALSAEDGRKAPVTAAPLTVLFVCEHGSVKSLIAQEWFNRLARERGLDVRATSRGLSPDASVPAAITAALQGDGFDVRNFTPRRVDAAATRSAARIVAIGTGRAPLPVSPSAAVETWDRIPAATEHYEAARDAIKARVEALLTSLEASGAR